MASGRRGRGVAHGNKSTLSTVDALTERFDALFSSYVSRVESRVVDSLVWLFAVLHALRFSLAPELAGYHLKRYFELDVLEDSAPVPASEKSCFPTSPELVSTTTRTSVERPRFGEDEVVDEVLLLDEEAAAEIQEDRFARRPSAHRKHSDFAASGQARLRTKRREVEQRLEEDEDEGRGRARNPRLLWRSKLDRGTTQLLDFGQALFVQPEARVPRPRVEKGRISSAEGARWSRALDLCGL